MSVGLRRWVLPLLSNLGLKSIKFLDGINCIEPKGVKYKKSLEDSYEEIELPLEVHAIPYKKVRTQYWHSSNRFADHERDAPE